MSAEDVIFIQRLVQKYADASDSQVLADLSSIPPIADENDPCWRDEEYYFGNVHRYSAFLDIAELRRLRPAVRLLLERACYGDPGEMMRCLPRICFSIYKPDWKSLADELLSLAQSERLGTRLWAISGLVWLDDPRAVDIFKRSAVFDSGELRDEAIVGLKRLLYPHIVAVEKARYEARREQWYQERLDKQAADDAHITNLRCEYCGKPMPSYRRTCKHFRKPSSNR